MGEADLVALFVEEVSHQVAVGAGGFQAGMDLRVALTQEPVLELSQTFLLIGKTLEGASGGFRQEHPHL